MRNCCLCCCTWVLTGVVRRCWARDLLADFNGLIGLARAGGPVLMAHPGMGPARYARLAASMELARRQALQEMRANGGCAEKPRTHAAIPQASSGRSLARGIYLSVHGQPASGVALRGSVFRHARRRGGVTRGKWRSRALQYGSAAVIFAHNHPSGVSEPSAADRRITERLVGALALLDIRVLDHIIVGSGQSYSFAEQGLL